MPDSVAMYMRFLFYSVLTSATHNYKIDYTVKPSIVDPPRYIIDFSTKDNFQISGFPIVVSIQFYLQKDIGHNSWIY